MLSMVGSAATKRDTAIACIQIRGIPPFANNAKDGAPAHLLHFPPCNIEPCSRSQAAEKVYAGDKSPAYPKTRVFPQPVRVDLLKEDLLAGEVQRNYLMHSDRRHPEANGRAILTIMRRAAGHQQSYFGDAPALRDTGCSLAGQESE